MKFFKLLDYFACKRYPRIVDWIHTRINTVKCGGVEHSECFSAEMHKDSVYNSKGK